MPFQHLLGQIGLCNNIKLSLRNAGLGLPGRKSKRVICRSRQSESLEEAANVSPNPYLWTLAGCASLLRKSVAMLTSFLRCSCVISMVDRLDDVGWSHGSSGEEKERYDLVGVRKR